MSQWFFIAVQVRHLRISREITAEKRRDCDTAISPAFDMMVVPLAWTGDVSALMTAAPPAVERLPDLFQGVSYSVLVFLRHLRFWSKAHGVLLTEGYTVKFQSVLLCHLRKEVCQLLTCGVGSAVIKVNIRDEAGRDLEDHIIAFHREVDIRVLLHIVRIGICDGVFLIQCEEQMLTEVALTEQLYADVLVLVVGQRDLFRRLQGDSVRKPLPRRRSP